MASTESPAVARRRLRLALRRVREAKAVTQGQVAEALEWSLSKVNRIESGDVTISNTDLRALLTFLGVTDPTVVERLTEDARASRRRGWWDEARYREHLSPATLQLLQFESEASAIRCFQPTLFPGLIQTRGYAESIVNFWSDDLSESDRSVRVDVRVHRHEQVFGRPDPPQYLLILDESVVLREVGGPQAMAEQLQGLLSLIEQRRVTARIVPLAEPGAGAMIGPFIIFDLGEEENAVLYRERHNTDEIVQTPEQVRQHRRIFEQMWENALTEEATTRLISARSLAMLASLDRNR